MKYTTYDDLRSKVNFIWYKQYYADVLGCMYMCIIQELIYDYTSTCTSCRKKSKYRLMGKMKKCLV